MRCNPVARKVEADEVDEAPLLRPALDAAAPVLGRAQGIALERLDSVPIFFAEVVKARGRASLRMQFQNGDDDVVVPAPARFARLGSLSHGSFQT